MTDRVRHLTVILEDDMRDEDESVGVVINAIKMIRCVAEVHKYKITSREYFARQTAKSEPRSKILDAVVEILKEGKS